MSNGSAVEVALSLLHLPSRVSWQLAAPLPDTITDVLEIAAGDQSALQAAVVATGQSAETIVRAAEFFLEQIVLAPRSDSYRLLASNPKAPIAELRRNMALLMRWLHPDQRASTKYAVYASRVTQAWEDVKTRDRRDAYDAGLARTSTSGPAPDVIRPLSKRKLKKQLRAIRMTAVPRPHSKIGSRPGTEMRRGGSLFQRALRLLADRFR